MHLFIFHCGQNLVNIKVTQWQCILSLLLFVTNNKSYFTTNSENYSIHTMRSNELHLPQMNLAICKKRIYYSGVKIFNNLPSDIKNNSGNHKRFKRILKHFLITPSFYTSEEYYTRWYIRYMIQLWFNFKFNFSFLQFLFSF